MQSSNIKYLPQVDHLRAFAAIWIILYHSLQLLGSVMLSGKTFSPVPWPEASSPITSFIIEGHSAVALFMVLSGFIFSYGAYGKTVSYKDFIFNRVLRIYPLFIALMMLSILVDPSKFSTLDTISTLFFLGDVGNLKTNDIIGMSWAVAVEFQFYLIFPFVLASLNSSAIRTVIGIILVATVFRALAVGYDANARDLSYFHISGRIDQFVLGMGAAVLFKAVEGRKKLLASMMIGSAIAVVVMLFVLNKNGGWLADGFWKIFWPTIEGCVYALFIVGYVGTRNLFPNILSGLICRVGECSFSIYLLHFPIVILIARKPNLQWHPTGVPMYDFAATLLLIAIPVTLVVSFLTYRVIELPFLSRRRKYLNLVPQSPLIKLNAQVRLD